MGDASARSTREERVAAALAREDARRAAWADEMVADAAAIYESAVRHARGYLPEGTTDAVVVEYASRLASLAAQRAVAADLVDAVTAEDSPELDDVDESPALHRPAPSGFSLVAPKPK